MTQQKIILIGGPTASGKSALAMQIARRCNGAIINADAMQIYAGLPLLTAQPDQADKAEIPHLLYEITDPAEASSVAKWLALAKTAIADAQNQGRAPIMVGGSGMYFEGLLNGLAIIPDIPPETRAAAGDLYDRIGEEAFRADLAKYDSASARSIARNDRQRLLRAWEVVVATGRSLKEWQQGGSEFRIQNPECHLLMPPRDQLYAACDCRFLKMIENGAIDEVKNLLSRNLSPTLPAMKILGVREIAAYLQGESNLESAIELAQKHTRNYAKRQMTWFRNRWRQR